jgi:tetratricopeptide (TPR) repeat protein/tRNA A-37 threonylcarbamoyl transferase component Bud32
VAPAPQRWKQIEEIFLQALEQPPEERARWVETACGGDAELRADVSSLLASDSAAGFVGAKVQQAVVEFGEETSAAMKGRQVGPYRLIRQIGRGGMGAVYLAVRADEQYESRVAIKLVQPGLDTDFILRRFRRERQILARLEHPNISRMFDGGATEEGIPYLVMEYIDGAWITAYALERNLSLADRIRLCLPVCDAVEYAHRNFIVHRDLKPGNILIDRSGTPKLLDFGISKLLHGGRELMHTEEGAGPMTPDYASPEQILGEAITVASDIYSLGAVLYELLTGVRPHRIERQTPLGYERAICIDPTLPPSQVAREAAVARRLKGDLDNIVMRAMQKEPARRYSSVEHLADDLRRFLEHRPVTARPDSFIYRTGKFVRRNLLAVTLCAVAAVAVIGGSAIAIEEARIAGERFQDVRTLATTFVFDVESAARDVPGTTRVRQLITRTGLDYLNRLARNSARDWGLKRELAAAYLRIGTVQGGSSSSNLGDSAAALASFESAGRLLDEVLAHSPSDRQAAIDRMAVYSELAQLHREASRLDAMGPASRAGLQIAQARMAADPKDLDAVQWAGTFYLFLARFDQLKGNYPAAESDLAAGGSLLERVAQARPDDRQAQLNLADLLGRRGSVGVFLHRTQDALANFRSQVSVLTALCERFPTDPAARHELMLAYSHVGDVLGNPEYDNLGDQAGAMEAYRKMVDTARILYDADQKDVRALMDYGIATFRLGLIAPAETGKLATLENAQKLLARTVERSPQNRLAVSYKSWVEGELAAARLAAGDRAAGIRYYRMAIATVEEAIQRSVDDNSIDKGLVVAARGLAEEQARAGARSEALAALDHALRLAKNVDAAAGPGAIPPRMNVARAWQAAGSVYAILGDREAARSWNQRSLEEWQKLANLKGFPPSVRKEMEAAAQALAGSR